MAPRLWAAAVVALALVLTSLALLVGATSAPAAPPAKRPHGVTHESHAKTNRANRPAAPHRQRAQKHRSARRVKHVSLGMRAVQIANHMTGVPYAWGGESPSGFDCSGLVRYVYGRLGVSLPHHAASQYGYGRPVRGGLRPGDLVFFSGLGHVGIYAGHGKFIHAPRSGTTVRWQSLASRMSGYVGARRVVSA